jgi:hypothetical protein
MRFDIKLRAFHRVKIPIGPHTRFEVNFETLSGTKHHLFLEQFRGDFETFCEQKRIELSSKFISIFKPLSASKYLSEDTSDLKATLKPYTRQNIIYTLSDLKPISKRFARQNLHRFHKRFEGDF